MWGVKPEEWHPPSLSKQLEMEAGVFSESLVIFEKCVRRHIYKVSDTVFHLPDKVISENVNSHTLKYSHNKQKGCEL